MTMPGFSAEASLSPTLKLYGGEAVFGDLPSDGRREVRPQFRFQAQSDPDWGAYWRCRVNGGSELVCRFFGGLPPFTMGGVLTSR